VIEQLETEKSNLAAELKESSDRAKKATELTQLAEEEATQLKSILQAAEMEKQMLQQQVHNLTGLVEFVRATTAQSLEEYINRLKLDMNIFTER